MSSISYTQLIPVLQVAIGPVILISGVGLVLMLLTNRLGRSADRIRQLTREYRETDSEDDRHKLASQIEMLFRRAKVIQTAIAFAGISALFAATLVITLFVSVLWHLDIGMFVTFLFILCLVFLISSLGAFMFDVQWTLSALHLELQRSGKNSKSAKF